MSALSRADLDAQQAKLDQSIARQTELLSRIKEMEDNMDRLSELRARADRLRQENDQEEERQMQELSQATNDLYALRNPAVDAPKWTALFETSKIGKLESSLAAAREKFDKASRQHDELAANDAANEIALAGILDHIRAVKTRYRQLEKFKVRLPSPDLVILHMLDAENTYSGLVRYLEWARSAIPQAQAKIQSLTARAGPLRAELARLDSDSAAIYQDLEQTKTQTATNFLQLETFTGTLKAATVLIRSEEARADGVRSEIDALRRQTREEETALRSRLEKCQEARRSFPARMQAAKADGATLVHKKKSLVEQLEKKLDDMRHDLVARQSNTPTVQRLTAELEREWMDHQRLLDICERKTAAMHKKEIDLQRTHIAIEEIRRKWPAHGAVKAKRGFGELEFLYEESLTHNRQMGIDLAAVTEDVAAHQEMNSTLREMLAGRA